MIIDILTLFPKMFKGPFGESIVKRAIDKGLIKIDLHDLRQWAIDARGSVDDRPYGGGVGMVIRVDVVDKALRALKIKDQESKIKNTNDNAKIKIGQKIPITKLSNDSGQARMTKKRERIILLTPQGRVFDQEKAREFSKLDRIILICGHYEGFDERIREHLVDEELSIGEYVLTGGELPAMVVTDAITRLIPGVLAKEEATLFESFGEFPQKKIKDQRSPKYTCLALEASPSTSRCGAGSLALARSVTSGQAKIKTKTKNLKLSAKDEVNPQPRRAEPSGRRPVIRNTQTKLLEYPQYTRPEEFNGWKVPKILLSGDHKRIEEWKRSKIKVKR